MNEVPSLINGGNFKDDRGLLKFFNDFSMSEIKRMYSIEHFNTETIRAWQGHKVEQKWFYVVQGGFKFLLIKPDNWASPAKDLDFIEYTLLAENNQVLHVPGGYINGFKAVNENSKLMVFSDLSIEVASTDNLKFDKEYWNYW